jgi:hypothetical protein
MPRFSVTGPLGPEAIDYGWLTADSPLEALHKLHAEPLGYNAIRLVDGHLVFANPADQDLCAGRWRITEFRRNGTALSMIEIVPPDRMPAAA